MISAMKVNHTGRKVPCETGAARVTVARMNKLILSFALLIGLAGGVARAEDKKAEKPADKADKADKAAPAEVEMPWEKACDADIKKICADVKDDVRACLADHEKELSKGCTKHFSAAGYRVLKYCEADIQKLCAAEAAANKLPQCMNAKAAQLSPKCRQALTPPKPADPNAEPAAPAPKKKSKKK
jgi:hypothetical protein